MAKETFKLDLDTKEFLEKLFGAKKGIEGLGNKENLEGLTEGLLKAGALVGVLGVAAFALKKTFDTVFEGEEIRAINSQFEALAKNAGIAGDALKEGLVKAAGGLADDTDLMKAANKSIIEMGASASKLPEIMELARKNTAAFGGDLVQNFEGLSAAMARGNARALKQYGIIIDSDQAMIKYAKSIGVTVGALTESERRQAVMNEALIKGKQALSGIDEEAKKATNTWTQIKVIFQQVAETVTLAFEKTAGPSIRSFLSLTKDAATSVNLWFKEKFGEGAEAAAAHTDRLRNKADALAKELDIINKKGSGFLEGMYTSASNSGAIDAATEKLAKMRAEIEAAKPKEEEKKAAVTETASTGEHENRIIDAAKTREAIAKIKQEEINDRLKIEDDYTKVEDQLNQQKLLKLQEVEAQVQIIKSQFALGKISNEEQMQAQIDAIQMNGLAEMQRIEQAKQEAIQATLQLAVNSSQTTGDAIAASFKKASIQASQDWSNFGKTGQRVTASFENNAVDAFKAVGSGQKDAADAAKGFVFGMIGDEAEARGKMMLLASIWPPNPIGLAAGGGLIALGAFLKSQGGASSGGGGAPSAGGGGGADTSGIKSGSDYSAVSASPTVQQTEQQKKVVSVHVQGSYYETEQTKMRLVEMIREATDATDFNVKQIGQQ